jgi:uncharacterized protein (DUF3820 family)
MSRRLNHEHRNRLHKVSRQGDIADTLPSEFQKEYQHLQESTMMPFGKWEGRSLRFIFETDRPYLQWLMQQPWFKERFWILYDIVSIMYQELGMRCDDEE